MPGRRDAGGMQGGRAAAVKQRRPGVRGSSARSGKQPAGDAVPLSDDDSACCATPLPQRSRTASGGRHQVNKQAGQQGRAGRTVSSSIALRSAIIQKSGTPAGTASSSAAAAALPSAAATAALEVCCSASLLPRAGHRLGSPWAALGLEISTSTQPREPATPSLQYTRTPPPPNQTSPPLRMPPPHNTSTQARRAPVSFSGASISPLTTLARLS